MGNYNSTKAEIKNYICARTPLVVVDSPERERVERILREISTELDIRIGYYTDAKQVSVIGSDVSKDAEGDPLAFIASYFRKNRNSTFAIGDIKRIGEDNVYSREVLNILYLAKEMNCTLILITADTVWSRLSQFGMLTTLDYPDMNERTAQISDFIGKYRFKYPITLDESDVRMASTLLRGFTEIQIENILSTALINNRGLSKDNLYELTGQKSRLYSAVSSIQKVNVSRSLTVSGLEGLKRWLSEKKNIFFASDEALSERDLTTPKGILLCGVPGCGKSLSAKMVAKEWELPLFRFDLGTIYDKWVGESEKKMKEALRFIDNVSPCIVWVDEIEKALSVSDSGNDTGKRVLGQFLFWLQESTSRVFLVATANDISALPFELFRKGRFSEIFFIDLPNYSERRATISQYAKKSLHCSFSDEEMDELCAVTEGFSYSDIEYAIKDAALLCLTEGQEVLTMELVLEKFRQIVPISKNNPEMLEKIRKWGEERAVAASDRKERA
ncbi:MAG: AAA family ATPase [Ruminococcaceae bacterium]|nr:AAA family ATPase [Oscillospiraceae bacterium]